MSKTAEYHECLNCGSRMEREFVSWEVPGCTKCGDHLDVIDVTNKVWEELEWTHKE